MTMYPKLFAGGLKGLMERLDYLSEQGITYLHLMPLLKMPHPMNDGGYAVEDFRTVDEEIGTNEELEELTKELRKRRISLCLDVVMNHTADSHEWAVRARAGEQEYIDRYQCLRYLRHSVSVRENHASGIPVHSARNFTWCEEMKKYVLTTFYPYQWDLNYHNPTVFNEMTENILFLANMGVEIFRIDAVPYIWKELGTNCRNLPQVHKIVRMLAHHSGDGLPGCDFKGRSGDGAPGTAGLFRNAGASGMPYALRRLQHGEPVGGPGDPGYEAFEASDGRDSQLAGELLLRQLFTLP